MASSPAHRSALSTGQANLRSQSPGARHRHLTSPSQTSLNIPEGGPQQQFVRPPSPLRNGFIPDSGTGIDVDAHSGDDDDDAHWEEQSLSPSSSVSQLAANLAQRVGSLVDGIKSRPQLPTDEELEAAAQRERDRSRREAEAILNKETQQRRLVEDRVLSMIQNTRSLPQPPSRTELTSEPPSPAGSLKDSENVSWWTAAKKRLTPTKEPLTPAQQVIHDAKSREKEMKKSSKGKEKAYDWESPSRPSDTIFNNLNIPAVSPQRKPVHGSPVSPTPSRPSLSNMAPNLTPSPMRSVENLSSSPSREVPPLYAQFNGQGTLDVPGTLLVIAKRFEKLEKWTVGHVRALEERMNDVERWLVDKEKEREGKDNVTPVRTIPGAEAQQELNEIREEIGELQGRVGMLGREMAKLATAPPNLSSGPSRHSPVINTVSLANSMIASHHSPSGSTSNTPHHSRLVSVTARESTSPPMAASSNKAAGTKLPYPTGDYASPNNSFSPPNSPPAAKTRHMSIPGLPNPGPTGISPPAPSAYPNASSTSTLSLVRAVSPVSSLNNIKQTSSPSASITSLSRSSGTSPNLPAPKAQTRQSSISPTPRKRYTVALGEPIRSQSPHDEEATPLSSSKRNNNGTPISFSKPQTSIGTAMFSGSHATAVESGNDDEEGFQDETIGKATARLVSSSVGGSNNESGDVFAITSRGGYKSNKSNETTSQPSSTRPPRRPRPQSTYAYGTTSLTLEPPQASIQPLNVRIRSKSTDRFGSMESLSSVSSLSSTGSGRFVDPLLVRKQEQEQVKKERGRSRSTVQNPRGKVPVGQLVAFFDGDKKESKS